MKTPKKKTVRPPRKGRKTGDTATRKGEISTTSVAFRTKNLLAVKNHDLVKNHDRSVSWIVNKLMEKFLAGEVKVE